jgi:hypothetical protein
VRPKKAATKTLATKKFVVTGKGDNQDFSDGKSMTIKWQQSFFED